jgi:alpha-acetolactate decarboxylase
VTIFADPYFRGVTLTGLEVTGAMSNSYVLRFNVTDDLRTGTHVLEITIKDAFGNMAKKRFENVTFELQ